MKEILELIKNFFAWLKDPQRPGPTDEDYRKIKAERDALKKEILRYEACLDGLRTKVSELNNTIKFLRYRLSEKYYQRKD
jgi:predicted  nucleic acid-binding Zn-ribbon protein